VVFSRRKRQAQGAGRFASYGTKARNGSVHATGFIGMSLQLQGDFGRASGTAWFASYFWILHRYYDFTKLLGEVDRLRASLEFLELGMSAFKV
jgi:hypothetical protein